MVPVEPRPRYGSLTHLGVLNGLNREFPVEIGRQNSREAEMLRRSSFGFLLTSATAFVALALLFGTSPKAHRGLSCYSRTIVVTAGICLWITSLKAEVKFHEVARIQALSAIVHQSSLSHSCSASGWWVTSLARQLHSLCYVPFFCSPTPPDSRVGTIGIARLGWSESASPSCWSASYMFCSALWIDGSSRPTLAQRRLESTPSPSWRWVQLRYCRKCLPDSTTQGCPKCGEHP